MNLKTIVLLIFAVWSGICWKWYVCGIKEACDKTETTQPDPIVVDTTHRATTADTQQVITPAKGTAANSKTPAFNSENIDRVQMESVEDQMVIHFPYNSIRKEDNASIDDYLSRLASELSASGKTVTIAGHTDFVGDAKANLTFGLKRANSIRDILIKKGVKGSQVKCKSYGDAKPIATNDTPQGRYKNRRVEIRVKN